MEIEPGLSIQELKDMIEDKRGKLKDLKSKKLNLEKLRNLSDLKIVFKGTYDSLREDESLIDRLIQEKGDLVKSLDGKIEKLEKRKKIEETITRMFSEQDDRKKQELEKYVNRTKSLSSVDEAKKIDFIVENLKVIKPAYAEYERLKEVYRFKLEELSSLQKQKPNFKSVYGYSSYFLVLAILVLVLNIILSYWLP